jgi:hypothetical protein
MKIHEKQLTSMRGHIYTVIPCEFEDRNNNGWSDELKTVNLWCWKSFGEQGETYNGPESHRWYQQNGNFWFRDERDYAWFMLRWS